MEPAWARGVGMPAEDESVPETSKSSGCISKEEFDIEVWKLRSRLLLTQHPCCNTGLTFCSLELVDWRKVSDQTILLVHEADNGVMCFPMPLGL